MTLDPAAVGSRGGPRHISWTHKDVLLYAVGIGAGHEDLAFSTEHAIGAPPRVYPTFGVVAGSEQMTPGMNALGRIGTYELGAVVHGAHSLENHRPIPTQGTAVVEDEVVAMYDKGNASVVTVEERARLESGEALWTSRMTVFIRGLGGWGGERGPATERIPAPDRSPDHLVEVTTGRDQAYVYRLSGDRNPLHVDPVFAREAGFDQPILHGLCTYGMTARAALRAVLDDDVARWRGFAGRFSAPVFPGETLTIAIWDQADGRATFTTSVDDRVVLADGLLTYDTAVAPGA
jgi:acyl dehydratase